MAMTGGGSDMLGRGITGVDDIRTILDDDGASSSGMTSIVALLPNSDFGNGSDEF